MVSACLHNLAPAERYDRQVQHPARRQSSDMVELETLAVEDGWTRLVVFTFGNPHLLECTQRRQDASTNPNRILAFWRCDNLDFHGRRCQGREFFGHALSDSLVHSGTTRQDNISV